VRTGHKDEAEKEFAILRTLSSTERSGAPAADRPQ